MMAGLLRFPLVKFSSFLAAAVLCFGAGESGFAQQALSGFTVTATNVSNPNLTNVGTQKQTIRFTAATSGTAGVPTGNISFFLGADATCASDPYNLGTQALDGNGMASITATQLPAGQSYICAAYAAAYPYSYTAQTTNPAQVTFTSYSTSFTVTNPGSVLQNQPVNFIATIGTLPAGGPLPTGSITIDNEQGSPLGTYQLTNGTVSFALTGFAPGSYDFQSTYSGDANYFQNYADSTVFIQAALTAASPGAIVTGSPDTPVTLTGAGFTNGSVVQATVNNETTSLVTTYQSPTSLLVTVPAADLITAGAFTVAVNTAGALTNSIKILAYTQYTDQVSASVAPTNVSYGQTGQLALTAGVTRGGQAQAAVPTGQVSLLLSGSTTPLSTIPLAGVTTPGAYFAATQTPVETSPGGLLTADFNGDGVADAVLGAGNDGYYVDLFLGGALDTFQSEIQVYIGCPPTAVRVADLNQDGAPDLLVACEAGQPTDPILIYVLGNGNGSFQQPVTVATQANTTLAYISNMALGDFNGDGALDAAMLDGNGGVQVFTGSAPFGTFTAQPKGAYPIPSGYPPTAVVAADFNQDGKSDLVLLEAGYGSGNNALVAVLTSNGDGTFAAQQLPFTTPAAFFDGLTVTDVNGDGFPDVAVADPGETGNADAGQLLIFENNGSGTLGAAFAYPAASTHSVTGAPFPVIGKPAAASLPPWSLVYTSVNENFSDPNAGQITATALQRQTATSYTVAYTNPNIGIPVEEDESFEPVPIVAGDFNGDGNLDLLLWTGVAANQNSTGLTPLYFGNDAAGSATANLPLLGAGNYTLAVSYPGDENFAAGATQQPIPFLVSPANAGVTVFGGGTSQVGQSVTFSVTITGVTGGAVPGGSVQFYYDDGTALGGPQTVTSANGVGTAQLATAALPSGIHSVYAIYNGDPNYLGGQSVNSVGMVVSAVTQTTPVVTWPTPAPIAMGTALSGTQLDATASVAGTFVYTPAAGTVLAPGAHTLSVLFTPTDTTDYTTTTQTVVLLVTGTPSTTTLTVTPGTATTGQVVTLQAATVADNDTPIETGSTTFFDGTIALGTVQIAGANAATGFTIGQAIFKTHLGPGVHSLTAQFNGTFGGTTPAQASVSTATALNVTGTEPSTLALTAAPDATTPANYDFTAVVSGFGHAPPAGTVNFIDQTTGVALGSAPITMATGQFDLQAAPSVGISESISTSAMDLNNDGIPDLVVEYYTGGFTQLNVAASLGNGDGTFQAPVNYVISGGSGNYFYNALQVVDLNHDGIPDIMATSTDAQSVFVLIGIGDGTFAAPVAYGNLPGVDAISIADINGDGIPDAVVNVSGGIAALIGNGDGTFQAGVGYLNPPGSSVGLVTGRFTDSGATDVVVGDYFNQEVTFFAGNADGTFKAGTTIAVGDHPNSLVAGDWNGDGHLDLAVTNQNGDTVSILLGNGDGTFQAQVTYPVGVYPTSVVTADVNGDGIPDLLVANFDSSNISVLQGVGDGTFLPQPAIPLSSESLSVGDFNGDGVPDIADAGQSLTVALGGTTLTTTLPDVPIAGAGSHTIQGTFVPAANSIYNPSAQTVVVSANGSLLTPVITWPTPAGIIAGTTLSATQLNATASVPGTFTYTPPAGTVLAAGTYTLSVLFTPTDVADYTTATQTVTLVVAAVTQTVTTITWPTPAPITYGTPLSALQLDATAIPAGGTFVYNPPAGTVLNVGTQTLSVTYTPLDTTDFSTATATVTLVVNAAIPPPPVAPTLTAINPPGGFQGSGDTTITLTGSGFLPTSAALLNGTAIATTYTSATQLQAVIPAAFFTAVQTGTVTVTTPGFAPTAGLIFSVLPPQVTVVLNGPPTSPPASQPTITFQLPTAYPAAITGTFTLTVTPSAAGGPVDPAVQFLTGGDTFTFTLPANTTTTPTVQLQTGTLAGTITVTLTLTSGGVDITPSTLQPVVIQVPPSAPTITSMVLTRSGNTLTATIQGYSNTRDMKTALFTFTAATGATLNTSSLTVTVDSAFVSWYGDTTSDQFGSAFTYVQNFALSDDATTVGGVSVTLVNSVGNSNTESAQ